MSSQTRKSALRQLERTEFLVTSTRTQKPIVNARLGELASVLPGPGDGEAPRVPDWDLLQDFNVSVLEFSYREVRQAERLHRLMLSRGAQLRALQRGQIKVLKSDYRDLRKTFAGTYGEEAQLIVGLDSPPSRAIHAFREQLLEIVARMRDPQQAAQLPEPRAGQEPINLEKLAESQAAAIEKLEDTIDALKEGRKRADGTFVAKSDVQKRHQQLYVNVARVQEGLYRLAGLGDLADRIRTPERTARRKPEEEVETETAESEADATDPTGGDASPAPSQDPATALADPTEQPSG